MLKILASTFGVLALAVRSAKAPDLRSIRGLSGSAIGVERGGGHRVRRAQFAAVHLSECFCGSVRLPGLRVDLRPQLHVLVELVRRKRTDLEVHHRVVGAAQLGAATDEGTFAIDGVLEDVVLVVLLGFGKCP